MSSSTTPADNANQLLSNVYSFGSALFFSLCAYAQMNDPGWNPVFFAIAYISCGVLPNLLVTSCPIQSIHRQTVTATLKAAMMILGVAIVFKIITVSPKLELAHDTFRDFAWGFMEHEEGRDTCGLMLLILHLWYLQMNYFPDPSKQRFGSSSSSSGGRKSANGGMNGSVSPVVYSLVVLAVLGWAVYMWIVHHPEMVQKYGLKHCQGEMFGRDGSEL